MFQKNVFLTNNYIINWSLCSVPNHASDVMARCVILRTRRAQRNDLYHWNKGICSGLITPQKVFSGATRTADLLWLWMKRASSACPRGIIEGSRLKKSQSTGYTYHRTTLKVQLGTLAPATSSIGVAECSLCMTVVIMIPVCLKHTHILLWITQSILHVEHCRIQVCSNVVVFEFYY